MTLATLLVPFDGSWMTDRALACARMLQRTTGAHLDLPDIRCSCRFQACINPVPNGEFPMAIIAEPGAGQRTAWQIVDTTVNGRGRTPGGEDVAAFTAETTISREHFGLVWNAPLETGGVLVGDAVRILIEVEALKEHGGAPAFNGDMTLRSPGTRVPLSHADTTPEGAALEEQPDVMDIVDEASMDSFPASDPPSWWAGGFRKPTE